MARGNYRPRAFSFLFTPLPPPSLGFRAVGQVHNPLLGPPETQDWRGTGTDLLTTEFPDESALVEGFVYPNGLSQWCGEGGIGKTWASIQLARAMALGDPWFGLRTEKSRVGMIPLEGTGGRYQERFLSVPGDRAWMDDVVLRCPGFPRGMPSFWDITDTTLRTQLVEFVKVYE